ncbi:Holliday junction branch migration protein RuvA [Bacteroidales bacterium OttesenSCG-928-K03]|nr:Holliday junction branch migration protein RuvA [Odoribacter sp. OttesenSCG-928-L07]MDL2239832.1 Holliday junction branch migration protein RuvA [Bacteroidales bacterium OttesenSCG-928-L14]MDL2240799.1 Holliday junction branch migration protein RuvA [Bacteroidales bacterium OttesenSCG-928-K22]MDL2242774.1 Holliday junction branch migration protein RuvA [Bacteroidales bacterium OttesenSCG-928-K03]
MYEYIVGKLVYSNPSYAVVECAGIGYNIQISVNTFSSIKDGETVKLFLHQILREDSEMLFGFFDEKERVLFRHLITVSGVGANTARVILSSNAPGELYSIIVNKESSRLKSVKGIGEKTAQRIVLDLADKLLKENFEVGNIGQTHNNSANEALSALTVLGFPRMAVEKALKKIIETKTTDLSVEELVKETLKIL